MAVPDFSQYTPSGTPGATADNMAAADLVQGANIRSSATTQLGEAQTNFLGVGPDALNGNGIGGALQQFKSSAGANGQWYGGARRVAEGTAIRNYTDTQGNIISQAHNALDDLTRQQAYAASGLII